MRRRQPNPLSEENIRRIDTKSRAKKQTHGFQVHFLRAGEVVTKLFSDATFGGIDGARRAARQFKRTALGGTGGQTSSKSAGKSRGAKRGGKSSKSRRGR
jgi:hypothetical protein